MCSNLAVLHQPRLLNLGIFTDTHETTFDLLDLLEIATVPKDILVYFHFERMQKVTRKRLIVLYSFCALSKY